MRICIVDERMPSEAKRRLTLEGFYIIEAKPDKRLPPPLSSHPDMLFFLGKGRIVCHKDYFALAEEQINKIAHISNSEMIISDENMGRDYPHDVLFNAAAVGDRLICRRDAVSGRVAELYGEENIINVKQGYAKCSTCVVSDKAIITADVSIAEAAEKKGIDVLSVSPAGVRLDGYDCGFIGGATGADKENVYFCGNVDLHPDGDKIKEFCEKHGKRAVSLSERSLYDYGTLIFI